MLFPFPRLSLMVIKTFALTHKVQWHAPISTDFYLPTSYRRKASRLEQQEFQHSDVLKTFSQKLTGFRTTWTLQVWLSIWKKYPVFVCCCFFCFLNLSPLAASAIRIMIWMHDCAKHILVFPPTQVPQAPHPETPIKPVWPGCIMNGVIFFQIFWQGLCKVFSFTFISDIGQ